MPLFYCAVYLSCIGILFFVIGRILPKNLIPYDTWLFRERPWEKKLYSFLKVNVWQDKVPDMSRLFIHLMPAKKITGALTNERILIMVKETCVAEYIHILLSIAGFFCLHIWNKPACLILLVSYILFGNVLFIIVQRYNRPRLIHLMTNMRIRAAERQASVLKSDILILSANTGEGHNSCANAIREEYEMNNEHCEIIDGLSFYSDGISRLISKGHIFLYRHAPHLFKVGYRRNEKHPSSYSASHLVSMSNRASEHLYAFLLDHDYGAVICTHVFPTLLVTAIHEQIVQLNIKTCFVATDHTCYPMVELCRTDRYFIPDALHMQDFVKGEITPDKITVSGIPVRKEFYQHSDHKLARRKFNIPEDARHLLVMGGSMGCKTVMRIVDLLQFHLKKDQYITIVCGNNKKLERRLQIRYALNHRIHILGFVSDVSQLMDSADVYLTKPGGLSTTEAAVKGLPMVLIDAVAGCERYNMMFYTMCGLAVTARHIRELVELCRSLLASPKITERMREAASAIDRLQSAKVIRDTMLSCRNGESE